MGRTARAGKVGNALLFLMPEELGSGRGARRSCEGRVKVMQRSCEGHERHAKVM